MSPVVDPAPAPDGGYWLARSDGSVVGFGAEVPDGTVPAGRTVAMAARPASISIATKDCWTAEISVRRSFPAMPTRAYSSNYKKRGIPIASLLVN